MLKMFLINWLQYRNGLVYQYGEKFAETALSTAHRQLIKQKSIYKKMHNLYFLSRKSWIAYFHFLILNIFNSYDSFIDAECELAERLIRIGEITILCKIPNTVGSYQPLNWYEIETKHFDCFY